MGGVDATHVITVIRNANLFPMHIVFMLSLACWSSLCDASTVLKLPYVAIVLCRDRTQELSPSPPEMMGTLLELMS
jgi:hypothetical protein